MIVYKYSVLMSLYIKEKSEYLKKSIDSMINQSIKPEQIVIVKDGPLTNELNDVLDTYLRNFPNLFSIVNSEKNIGLGLALNLGLQHCRNELVARMDTDDISLPDRCEKQLNIFKENINVDIVGSWISEFVDNENNVIGKRIVPNKHEEIIIYLKNRCPFNHMSVMFKKSAVIKSDGYKDFFFNEDYYLWIRMYENKCNFFNIQESLVNVRVNFETYKRRGGLKYFNSELNIQKYMKNKKIISATTYVYNVFIRFILQIILPNNIRSYVFRKIVRN